MNNEQPELLPCPFCGGTEAFVERLNYSAAFVQCDSDVGDGCSCQARGPIAVQDDDGEEIPGGAGAIRNWNRRAERAASTPASPAGIKPSSLLTDAELADAEYMRAYVDELHGALGALSAALTDAGIPASPVPVAAITDLLHECKRFLEDMHSMPVDWTIKESQPLHAKVSAALASAPRALAEKPNTSKLLRLISVYGDLPADARGRVGIFAEIRAAVDALATPAAPAAQSEQAWGKVPTVTMNGHQMREALEFINPDGPDDELQADDELTFGVVQHKDDDGNITTGLCCWNDDTDGVYPLHDSPAAPAAQDKEG